MATHARAASLTLRIARAKTSNGGFDYAYIIFPYALLVPAVPLRANASVKRCFASLAASQVLSAQNRSRRIACTLRPSAGPPRAHSALASACGSSAHRTPARCSGARGGAFLPVPANRAVPCLPRAVGAPCGRKPAFRVVEDRTFRAGAGGAARGGGGRADRRLWNACSWS